MKKFILLFMLMSMFSVTAQFTTPKDEARNEMMGRADMITFSAGITYVASFSFTLMDSMKDHREARLFATLGVGTGLGLLKELADVKCFGQKYNGLDVGYCVAGSLIGFAMTEATTAIIDFAHKRKEHKKLKL